MPPIDPNIQEIEAYLRGTLDPGGQRAFEDRLQQDAGLRREVEAYRKVLEGLTALQASTFEERMAGWEAEIDLETEGTLEKYLKGTLPKEARARLEKQLTADPGLSKRTEELKSLLDGFQSLQADEFSRRLQQWEKEEEATKPPTKVKPLWTLRFRRLAVAASFLLIVGVGLRWYAQANYNDQVLLETFYQPVATGGTLGGEEETADRISNRFEEAHQLLKAGEYREAVTAFEDVLNQLPEVPLDDFTRNYYNDNATFNLALALLGAGAPDVEVQAILQRVIETPNSDHLAEAIALQNKLGSFWRKVER